MKVVSNTNIGIRSENQDRVYTSVLDDGSVIAILCDGMGGENAGGFAAETAVNIIKKRILFGYSENYDQNSIRNILISSVSAANAAVFSAAGFLYIHRRDKYKFAEGFIITIDNPNSTNDDTEKENEPADAKL